MRWDAWFQRSSLAKARCVVFSSITKFGPDHRREVGQFLDAEGGGEHGVVRAAGFQPAFG